ncbi:MAG: hypothetical protein R3E40_07980 [Rhodocyclaceae bacterium]
MEEAEWPECDAIVGNPPFLGDKMMRGELGAEYTDSLRKCYEGRVPGGADLVTYWFEGPRRSKRASEAADSPPTRLRRCQLQGTERIVQADALRGLE